jgi:hypothetical protein
MYWLSSILDVVGYGLCLQSIELSWTKFVASVIGLAFLEMLLFGGPPKLHALVSILVNALPLPAHKPKPWHQIHHHMQLFVCRKMAKLCDHVKCWWLSDFFPMHLRRRHYVPQYWLKMRRNHQSYISIAAFNKQRMEVMEHHILNFISQHQAGVSPRCWHQTYTGPKVYSRRGHHASALHQPSICAHPSSTSNL